MPGYEREAAISVVRLQEYVTFGMKMGIITKQLHCDCTLFQDERIMY